MLALPVKKAEFWLSRRGKTRRGGKRETVAGLVVGEGSGQKSSNKRGAKLTVRDF